MPRACPSLSVADASLLTKVASTAASSGAMLGDHATQPVVDRDQPLRQRRLVVGRHRAAGEEAEPIALDHNHAPAGAAEPRIDPQDANRSSHDGSLIAPGVTNPSLSPRTLIRSCPVNPTPARRDRTARQRELAATFADPRTYAAMAVSLLAGAVRGFAGFGSALIFVPLMSAIYDPRTAAGTFLLIDFAVGLTVLPSVWRERTGATCSRSRRRP